MERRNINREIKRVLYLALIMLITALLLLVSCNDGAPAFGSDSYSYITFTDDTRSQVSYTLEKYDDLYWFYKAEKTDKGGMTGTKTEWTPINLGSNQIQKGVGTSTVGPFSQGDWKFSLIAFKTEAAAVTEDEKDYAVYTYEETTTDENNTSTTVEKTIYYTDAVYKTGESGITTTLSKSYETIAVSVEDAGETGTLVFDNLYFLSDTQSTEATKVVVTLTSTDKTTTDAGYTFSTEKDEISLTVTEETDGSCKYSIAFSTATGTEVACGTYKCVVKAENPTFEGEVYFALYGSTTTVVQGEVKEKTT